MKKRIFAVAAALCLLAGTGAFAQDSKKAPMMKERPTAEQMAQRRTERMTEKLNLSEKQSKQLYEVNLQDIKEMQAQAEQMRAYRKAQAEKMKGILTPEQFEQWKQMQGPRHGMNRGPRMKDGRGDKAAVREGRKCAPCAGGQEMRRTALRKGEKVRLGKSTGLLQSGRRLSADALFLSIHPLSEGRMREKSYFRMRKIRKYTEH